jgi:thaumarchaeosortase
VPFFAFPVVLLYLFEPTSFEYVWNGRTVYIIFLWLLLIEIFLAWNKPLETSTSSLNVRTFAAFATMLFPTFYVIFTFMLGFRSKIIELGRFLGVPYLQYGSWFLETAWPLALEFFVFSCFFLLSVWLLYRLSGFRRFYISGFFIAAFSIFYILGGVLFPYGSLQAAQSFASVTVTFSARVLDLLGYKTYITPVQGGSFLLVTRNTATAAFLVYWPSAGIQSLILYSFTILLFLRNTIMPLWRKGGYFIGGAVGTFFANVLRIASIGIVGVNSGATARMFHDYYGELYFIIWMIMYLFTVFLVESYLNRRRQQRRPTNPCHQPYLSSLVHRLRKATSYLRRCPYIEVYHTAPLPRN